MSGALTRFRVLAYVVGSFLLLLTLGVVLRYGFDSPTLSQTVSPIHWFLYILYVTSVFDLGRQAAWPVRRMALVMLTGPSRSCRSTPSGWSGGAPSNPVAAG